MTDREISEIRKTLSAERSAVTNVHGCYVNSEGKIIASYRKSFGMMAQNEDEKYYSIFKHVLSGTYDMNLVDITFSASAVTESAQCRLLSKLRETGLDDEEALNEFYSKVIPTVKADSNYVILLVNNKYDVPYRGKDGIKDSDNSSEVYNFIICAICPVKTGKPSLAYDSENKTFFNNNGDGVIGMPFLGFLYPTFDDRQTNIRNALMYTKSTEGIHDAFISEIFGDAETPMAAADQNTNFKALLTKTFDNNCSFDIAKEVHKQICDKITEHKESKSPERLSISKLQVAKVLEDAGVEKTKVDAFTEGYNETFGTATDLSPRNIVDVQKLEVKTPEVIIKVSPGHSDMVETRVIDGVKYILVRADDTVELNGLDVNID